LEAFDNLCNFYSLLKFGMILCEASTRTTKDRDRLGNLTLPQRWCWGLDLLGCYFVQQA